MEGFGVMDNLINVYWYDVIWLADHIITWLFKISLLFLIYQYVEYLKWKD